MGDDATKPKGKAADGDAAKPDKKGDKGDTTKAVLERASTTASAEVTTATKAGFEIPKAEVLNRDPERVAQLLAQVAKGKTLEQLAAMGITISPDGKPMLAGSEKDPDGKPLQPGTEKGPDGKPLPAGTEKGPNGKPKPAGTDKGDVPPKKVEQQPTVPAVDAPPSKVPPEQTKATVDALSQITGERERKLLGDSGDGSYAPSFDAGTFKTLMGTKNEAERKAADEQFKSQYGKSLEDVARANLSGSDLADALKVLHRKDGDMVSQRADDIGFSLDTGASGWGFEKNIRDIYSSSTKAQIDAMDQKYRADHPDKPGGLYDAVLANPNVSDETKAALKILHSGADYRTPDESVALAQIGINKKDIGFFQEAMAKASPEARAKFLQDGGEDKIQKVFGTTLYTEEGTTQQSTMDSRHALDFAKYGKLSAATQIKDSTGAIGWTTNDKGLDLAVNSMNDTERRQYMIGKQLAEHPEKPVDGLKPGEKEAAQAYYKELHEAITKSSNATNAVRLEDMIATKGGGFIASMGEKRGTIYNSSVSDIRSSIQNMSQKDWQELRAHPERREDMEKMLKTLKGDADVKKLMEVFDAKMNPTAESQKALQAIQEMKPEYRQRYQQDEAFRKSYDEKVKTTLGQGAGLDAAQHMLDQIKNGKNPTMDLPDRLMTNALYEQNPAKAKADIDQALKDDPTLAERLKHPKTPEDKAFAERLQKSIAALQDPKAQDRMYELSQDAGKRPVLDLLKESAPGYITGADTRGTVTALKDMSVADQTRYREDQGFRDQVDKQLATNIKNPELLHSMQRMLEHVKAGEKPTLDVVGNMIMSTDQKQSVRDLAKAFQDDPKLRDRITNPKTPEDQQFAEDYKKTVQNTLGGITGMDGSQVQEDYTKYTDELLKNGRISIDKMAELEQGMFSADADKLFDHLSHISPEEKQRLLTDKSFQDKIFSGLNDERRKIAMAVVEQGELKPEDKIRMSIIGWGGGSDVANAAKAMKPEDMAAARARYAAKYSGDFDNDVLNKTSGQDKADVKRALAGQLSFEEQQEALRKEGIDLRSGFGAWASDNLFGSATGSQADNAMEQMGAKFTGYEVAVAKGETDPKKIAALQSDVKGAEELVKTALDNHRESRAAAADTVTDVAIGVVGVGSVIVSGGTSIPLIAGLGLSMGFVKMGAKAAMVGGDYDSTQALRDFTSGVIGGATSVLGPAELGAMFRVGSRAAGGAIDATFLGLQKTALETSLKATAKEELKTATESLVRHALTSGAAGVEPAAIKAAADSVISSSITGAAREKLVGELSAQLQQNLEKQWLTESTGLLNKIKQQAIEQGYNAGAGIAGAAAMSVTSDVMDGKSADQIMHDALIASLTGGVTALGMANAMKWGGKLITHVKERGATPEGETKPVRTESGPQKRTEGDPPRTRTGGDPPQTRTEGDPPQTRTEGDPPQTRTEGDPPKTREELDKQPTRTEGETPRLEKLPPPAVVEQPHFSNEQMLAMWNKALAENEGKPLSVVKGYYEAGVKQVDAAAHPKGLIISSTESPMKLQNDLTVKFGDGTTQTFKAGSELPNGLQISPSEISVNGEVRTINGGKLIQTSADGTVLKTGEFSGPAVVEKGQIAEPGQYVVSRPSTDYETGAPRIDTYTNKDLSRWEPVEGKPDVYAPKIAPGAKPVEVIKVPEGYQGKFEVSYGGEAPFKPGDLIVREDKTLPDGTTVPAFRRISQADGLETYRPTDAASAKAFDDSVKALKAEHPEVKIARAAESATEFYRAASMPFRSTDEMLAMWNKAVAANEGKPLSVVKGYYEAGVKQVDAAAHPKGLIISSTESPMKLQNDLTVKFADGTTQTFKAGAELPNGFQISPSEISINGEVRTINGGKLIQTSADGTVLKSGEFSGPAVVEKGQIAEPGQYVVSRPSTDYETGAPRIDTYTNKDLSRWEPVEGKPDVYAPKIAPGAKPVEVIKVPENYQGNFEVSYGGEAPFKPGDLIVREDKALPDGTTVPAFRRISQADGLETYRPTDAASAKAFDDSVKALKAEHPEVKIARAAESATEFYRAASMPFRSTDEMLAMWNKAIAENEGKPLSVVKGYYEAGVKQVDAATHPKGLIISSTESPMKLQNDLTVKFADGTTQTFKAGAELPNGFQISPSEISINGEVRTISGGKLIQTSADGTVLKTGEFSGPAVVEKGQIAEPGQYVVSRPSTDYETGAPRIDTYTNKDLSRWEPVEGKPDVYAPKIAPGAKPVEVIKVPENYQGTFEVSYGGEAPFKPGDLIVREDKTLPDGSTVPAFRRISQADGLETYRPTDAASTKAFEDSVKALKAVHPEVKISRAAGNEQEFLAHRDGVFKGSDGTLFKYHTDGKLPDSTGNFELASAQQIKAEISKEPFTYKVGKEEVTSKPGDYRVTKADGTVYAESPEMFRAMYKEYGGRPGEYSVRPGLKAQQVLDDSAMDATVGGFQTARKGDWLITGANGEKVFLRGDQFKQRFSAKALDPGTEFGYYLKTLPIKAERGEVGKEFINPDGAAGAKPQVIADGDMIAQPIGQAPYLIPGSYFKDHYIDLPNGEWARKDLTMAQVLKRPETTYSEGSGLTEGGPGDYLVTRPNGNQEIVPKKKFDDQLALYSKEPTQVEIARSSELFKPEAIRAEAKEVDIDGTKSLTSPVHLTVTQALDESGRFPLGVTADLKSGELHFTFAHLVLDDLAKSVRAPLQEIRDGLEIRVNGELISSKLKESHGFGDPEYMEWVAPKFDGARTVEINFYGKRIGLYSYNQDKNIMMKLDSSKSLSAFDIREFHAKRGFGAQFRETGAVIDPTAIPANQIDLHTHFAGSMRAESILQVAREARTPYPTELLDKAGIKYHPEAVKMVDGKPTITLDPENFPLNGGLERLQSKLSIPEGKTIDFPEMEAIYVLRGPLVKDVNAFPLYLNEIAKDYQKQGVRYAELSLSDVLKPEWLDAAKASLPEIEKQTGVKLRFIVGMWRHSEHDYNEALVKKIVALGKEPYVVGADFMGEETNKTISFAQELKALAEYRKIRPEFQIRVHAGENPMNLDNIKEAIELGATRVGHGVYGVDAETLALAKKHDVIIEFNTNSNLALSNIDGKERLPVKEYLDAGVRISLGTDGHGLYQTSARSEEAVMKGLGLTPADLKKITESDRRYTDMMEKATGDNRVAVPTDAPSLKAPPPLENLPRSNELPHRSNDEMLEMWNKAVAENAGQPLSVIKGYYEAAVREVDAAANPKGLILSSTESPMTLKTDLTVKYPDGTTRIFRAGDELPNGMQISPADLSSSGEVRTINGGKLLTTGTDGRILTSGEISGSVTIEKGQFAGPGQFVVSRPSLDVRTGMPRIDTYTNKDTSRWVPVDGKPGLFAPKLDGVKPTEVIKVPPNHEGVFDVSYGGTAPFKPGDLIVREDKTLPDGTTVPAFRRITQADALETYRPTDAVSKQAFDESLSQLRAEHPDVKITPTAIDKGDFAEDILRKKVADQFPRYENLSQGQYQVTQELANIRVRGDGGNTVASLLARSPLQPQQKERILRALAEVREQFAKHRVDVDGKSIIDPVQKANWEHTARELGTVIEVGQRMRLSNEDLEDAMLSSMFSDAVKNADNFARHHLDGAAAADYILTSHDESVGRLGQVLQKYSDKNFTPERVQGIIKTILQTQSSPPKLMSELYGAMLKPKTAEELVAANNIKKYIADPSTAPKENTSSGTAIKFSDQERALLQRDTGLREWYVTDAASKQMNIAEAVLSAEAEETYRTLPGIANGIEMRGPGTGIHDPRIDTGLKVSSVSGRDALDAATRRKELVSETLGQNNPFTLTFGHEIRTQRTLMTRTERAVTMKKDEVEKWLRAATDTPAGAKLPSIPYWNADLKYPNRGLNEAEWSKVNALPEASRTAEQQKFWTDNQYGNLTPQEIKDFKFAQEIQSKFVQELRGNPPFEDYAPVMDRVGEVGKPRIQTSARDAAFDGPVLTPDQVKLDTPTNEYVKVAPVRAEKIDFSQYPKDETGRYVFTDPDTGALKPIGTAKDVENGYKDYAGYKVYKSDGSSYVNDTFGTNHVAVPGMEGQYFKQEIVKAQMLDKPLRINTGKDVEEFQPGDMMVKSAGGDYFVKKAEWDSLYAKQGGADTPILTVKLPPAAGAEYSIGENTTSQIWHDGISGGTIERTYDPATGGIKSITVADDQLGWTKHYEDNKLQWEKGRNGTKEFTKFYNYEHAEEVASLPTTQKVVDQLNQDVEYQRVKDVAEHAKVPEYDRKSPVDQSFNQKIADRIYDQLFTPPYEGATVINAEQATGPFTWTNKAGEVVEGHKGDYKVFNPDGSVATVIEPQFFDQAYIKAEGGKFEYVPPQKGNRVDIFNGLPGSGKTTNINNVRSKFGSRIVEADDNKVSLPGFHQDVDANEFGPILAARNGLGAKHLLTRSNDINDLVLMKALKEGYNVVLPGVGAGDPTWMINFLRDLKTNGHDVYAHFIEIPPAESAKRVAGRFQYELNNETPTGARLVQPEFMVTHGDFPRQNFDRMVRELFKEGEGLDGYEVIWNYGKNPRVLEEGHRSTD